MDRGTGGLQSMGSQRVGHDWATSLSLFTFMHWRRQWQPTPVFLPGESQGRGSLVGCSPWGHTKSDLAAAAAAAGDIWDLWFVSEVGQSHRAKALSLWDLHQVQGVGVRIELTWMEWDGIELMTPSWYWGLGNDDDGWCLLGTYYVPCACETHMFYVYFLR